eukprot:scaffold177801_cov35-Prasinocladus_malaysianus.AAC.2
MLGLYLLQRYENGTYAVTGMSYGFGLRRCLGFCGLAESLPDGEGQGVLAHGGQQVPRTGALARAGPPEDCRPGAREQPGLRRHLPRARGGHDRAQAAQAGAVGGETKGLYVLLNEERVA